MLDAFNRIVHNIALGPQIREVKNYLDAATIGM